MENYIWQQLMKKNNAPYVPPPPVVAQNVTQSTYISNISGITDTGNYHIGIRWKPAALVDYNLVGLASQEAGLWTDSFFSSSLIKLETYDTDGFSYNSGTVAQVYDLDGSTWASLFITYDFRTGKMGVIYNGVDYTGQFESQPLINLGHINYNVNRIFDSLVGEIEMVWVGLSDTIDPNNTQTIYDEMFNPDGTVKLAQGGAYYGLTPAFYQYGDAAQWNSGEDRNGVRYTVNGAFTDV